MRFRRGILTAAFAVVLCAMTSTVARAEQAASDSTGTGSALERMAREATEKTAAGGYQLPDSVEEKQIGIRFQPVYVNLVNGDVSSIGMKNSLTSTMRTPFGSVFNFGLSVDEKHYRLQDKFDENKFLTASVVQTFNIFTTGSIGFMDSRVFNRSIIPGGAVQDYIFNDKSVNAGVGYSRTHMPHSRILRSLEVKASGVGSAVQGERTYKDDQTLAAGGSAALNGRFYGRLLSLDAKVGHRETWDRSETSLTTFDGLGSGEDSLTTGMRVEFLDSIYVDANYLYYDGERTWADQAQGSLGGQQSGVENVFQETESRSARALLFSVNAKVWKNLRVTASGGHDSQLFDYAIQQTRYSNTVSDALKGAVMYTTPWKTAAVVTLENTETLRDFGPLSVSSYNDTRMKASLSLKHRFSKTFTADLSGSTQLTRSEYLDTTANPRDRDQIDTSVNLRFGSTPYKKLVASISLAYSASEIVNVDASQSSNNRTRDLYELRPNFTYYMSDKFSISQGYGVAIEYTDFTYVSENNFVDRNLIFTNRFDFKPSGPQGRIGFVFDYAYNFHDNGSYLPDPITGEEELSVQGEDRRDRVNLRMDYRVMSRTIEPKFPGDSSRRQILTIFGEERFSRFEDISVLTGSSFVTTDGQLTVGTRGDYEFGAGRKLTFSLARVRRDTQFGSEAEKEYWDIRSDFNFPL